ncbi:MAG TPA: cohesin domain-containing protein, partial [Roseiflexaceae bacterium]|nr:cohesin domain-containing protein [Roseiflexaceae bacterium]
MRAWITFALMLAFLHYSGAAAVSNSAAAGASLTIDAPTQVDVGQAITVTLTAKNVDDLAGYELNLLYDTSAAEFDSLRQRKNDLKKIGRDVGPLGVVEMSNGIALGLYSCPVDNCVDGKGPKQTKGGNGTVKLAAVVLRANQPGDLEIKIDAPKFVNANGDVVSLALSTQSIVVHVASAGSAHGAPAGQWQLPAASPPPTAPPDLTSDQKVTNGDIMEVALAWTRARESGQACGASIDTSRDINHDGCIDVADLQYMAQNAVPL